MIAISILAIVLVAVFQSQSFSLSLSHRNKFYTTASYLAQTCIAEIETKGSAATGTMKGLFGDDYPGYKWEVEVLSSPFPRTKKFKVIISNPQTYVNQEYVTYYYALEK